MAEKQLTSAGARKLLEKVAQKSSHSNPDWLTHTLCVGDCAGKIAAALGLDADHAKALGYLHDIGRGLGVPQDHIVNGYHFLKNAGYAEEYCNICLIHSFVNNNCQFLSGADLSNQSVADFVKHHRYTDYEEIVIISDLMCELVPKTMEERIMSILMRYGTSEDTQQHLIDIFELRQKLEKRLGHSIYAVIDVNPDRNK